MDYKELAREVKSASIMLGSAPEKLRNEALEAIAAALEEKKEAIFAENKKDLEAGSNLAKPILGRLKFDEHKLEDVTAGIRGLMELEDPSGKVLMERDLDEGLHLVRVTCPIGVIGVIFESRPDALVQISSLCIKSGNGAILKGGSEAKHTNKILFDTIYEAAVKAGLPEHFAALIEDRTAIDELITCTESIDLLIPRGSNAFVQHIMNNSDIPVMGHADGICHIYVDKEADLNKAIKLIVDSKTQYVAACNTAETLLLHKEIAKEVMERLPGAGEIEVEYIPAQSEADYREYLDYKMTVKVVEDEMEAIRHINRYGSHHTDAIITENQQAADLFQNLVDSAGVYHNASTRFADGFRYGFGAEVGISTGKMPPRGPVGLDGLVTYKYKLKGNGHIVADYASGKKSFHFKDK
ncbi:glutamate-5-semialdehyde dehydrogenase [Eubacterium oxidoreducens]|uniref:Gamma-glutamyl phosphate reductase n=1 Tax=Eubacterium oxidoreducens TaxID=1732 RepID=A0A1G6ABK2_EUBOX|nr:glutamate-5-semialdehyde dehydrogenase [Eubacterium oxidoreducens]SDB05463.1 glutamate-5-semialdehyde dehydrogenase [Eubacterium oxidoreducens]